MSAGTIASCKPTTVCRLGCSRRKVAPFSAAKPMSLRTERQGNLLSTPSTPKSVVNKLKCSAMQNPRVFFFNFGDDEDDYDEEYTVIKLQVGMFGRVRKFQALFERLSALYDTDDEESLHTIYIETLTDLTRNIEYCGYAYSAGKVFNNVEDAERKFKSVSFDERAKFREETLTNVDGRRRTRSATETSGDDPDSWLIVTLVAAIDGRMKLGKINSIAELRQGLKLMAGLGTEDLLAFELLWTPQAEGDSYSRTELLTDYPQMAMMV